MKFPLSGVEAVFSKCEFQILRSERSEAGLVAVVEGFREGEVGSLLDALPNALQALFDHEQFAPQSQVVHVRFLGHRCLASVLASPLQKLGVLCV